jgi:hypothetical protein
VAEAAFNKKWTLFTSKMHLELRNKLGKMLHLDNNLYGATTWTLRTVDQKHLEGFEM